MSGRAETVDYVVAGAGFGGLAAAALLASDGFSVVVLEASGLPGGCGQTFRRGGYRFDAGATTICGADGDLPLARLERSLGASFGLTRVDPGMAVWLDGERIDRHTDRDAWIDEAMSRFGTGQGRLWNELFRLSDLGWRVACSADRIPPDSAFDVIRTVRQAGRDGLRLLPSLTRSTERGIRTLLGQVPDRFARFVDEQLLITAQAPARDVPMGVGALGLTYTNYGTYTASGGVGGLADSLVRIIRDRGGTVRYGHRVDRIARDSDGYVVTTQRGIVRSRGVVSNLTVWNMADVGAGEIGAEFRRLSAPRQSAWGAFTLYIGVEDTFGDEPALHHQVIFDEPLPITGSGSVFVSVSPGSDRSRAPEGCRAVTVSTHTPCAPWWSIEDATYEDAKSRVAEAILDRIAGASAIGALRVRTLLTGSPRTFRRYTGRAFGRVGGIPSTFQAMVRPVRSAGPLPDLYLVGDTVFPGQGIPAVVLGAQRVADRIRADRGHGLFRTRTA